MPSSPRELVTKEAQIIKITIRQYIPESLHETQRVRIATFLLMGIQYFIKIANKNP
jgi:hypothetical protein